jgi:hypothetical protein
VEADWSWDEAVVFALARSVGQVLGTGAWFAARRCLQLAAQSARERAVVRKLKESLDERREERMRRMLFGVSRWSNA